MRFRIGLISLAGAVTVSAALQASPASAVPAAPQISALDVSVPGHVSGTASSDEPFVQVWSDAASAVVIPTAAGSAAFDMTTWGTKANHVRARACPDDTPVDAECSTTTVVNFTATDVAPEVVWPEDTTIGTDQTYEITVSDPDGGGYLATRHSGRQTSVAREGTSSVFLGTGTDDVELFRCRDATRWSCVPFSPRILRTVTKAPPLTGYVMNDPVNPHPEYRFLSTGHPHLALTLQTSLQSKPYTVAWHLEKDGTHVDDAGTDSGTLTGDGKLQSTVHLSEVSDVPDGTYRLVGRVTVSDPEFGSISGVFEDDVAIDRIAPNYTSGKVTRTTIYPRIGQYQFFEGTPVTISGDVADTYIEIKNAAGVTVQRNAVTVLTPTTGRSGWDGWATTAYAPAGTYTVDFTDEAGNVGGTVGTIRVSHQRLKRLIWSRTYSIAATTVERHVGRCSTLKRPVRGWVGSAGYYANTKCGSQRPLASEVWTLNRVVLPRAAVYIKAQVGVTGGAAAAKPRSRAVIQYLSTERKWVGSAATGSRLALHRAPTTPAGKLVWPGRILRWGLGTGYGNRFDAKTFRVDLWYLVLVD